MTSLSPSILRRTVITVLLAGCAHAPPARDQALVIFETAASEFTRWQGQEVEAALRMPGPLRDRRAAELAELSRAWNTIEDAFRAAWAALDAAEAARSATREDCLRRVVDLASRAATFLRDVRTAPP